MNNPTLSELQEKAYRERWSPRKLWNLGYGVCKDENCVFRYRQVPSKYWRYDDGRYLCPCGYGIAPHKPIAIK